MSKSRVLASVTVGLALAAMPASAVASGPDIDVQDRCDPVSFDAVLGPGACARPAGDGGGIVTFGELIARLQEDQEHGGWRFKDDSVSLKRGARLKIAMTRGGEFHTVTEVASFGLGCVPDLNALTFPGQDPTAFPAECNDPLTFAPGAQVPGGDGILPGESFSVAGLGKGTHRFMCMIHPWMKSKVTVK